MPQWGIEPHERARFAGWRRSLCAAKRRRPGKYAYMSGGYGIRPYAKQKFDPFGAKINSMG